MISLRLLLLKRIKMPTIINQKNLRIYVISIVHFLLRYSKNYHEIPPKLNKCMQTTYYYKTYSINNYKFLIYVNLLI